MITLSGMIAGTPEDHAPGSIRASLPEQVDLPVVAAVDSSKP
jgi:hypothetical protein